MIPWVRSAFPWLLVVPAFIPILFTDGLLFPYLTPKTLLFRADFLLALAGFIVLVSAGHTWHIERLRTWGTWIPGALLPIAYLSSALGNNFSHSFWSIFDRGDGLLTLTAIVFFFYALVLYTDEKFFERLLRYVAIVGSIVAGIAILQWIQNGSGLDIPLVPDPHGRLSSTLGNAAYLASYLGLTFFVTLMVARNASHAWQRYWYGFAGIQILAIVGSATRGTLLALLVAAGITTLYLAWRGEGAWRQYARYAALAGIIAIALFFMFRAQLAESPIEPLRRIATISLSDATVESRLFIWSHLPQEVGSRALLGYGAEMIEPLFNRVYDPTKIIEEWFDRTHNSYLDYFVQYGLVGLALYLALLFAFAREAWRRTLDLKTRFTGQMLVLLLVVYVVQNIFVFDNVATLWLLLALFAYLFVKNDKPRELSLHVPAPFAYALGCAALVMLLPVVFSPLRANLLLAQGYTYHVFDVDRANDSIEKGYALNTYAQMEYGYQLYEMYVERQSTMLTGGERVKAYTLVRDILAQNFERFSYDARTAVYYAHVLDLVPEDMERNEDLLKQVLARAIQLSPRRIQPHFLLANISIRAGDALSKGDPKKVVFYEEGIRVLREYSALVPTFAEPHYVIATLYQVLGKNAEAAEAAGQGLAVYKIREGEDVNMARRAARYYVTAEDWPNAARFLRDVLAFRSDEYDTKYDLAKAEFLAGNPEAAGEIVGELQKEAPGLVEKDPAFMQALQSALK